MKHVATGATTATFEVGGPTHFAPVAVSFASVTAAGDLTARVSSGEHPAAAGSVFDSTRNANRYWTLTNSGVEFTTYSAIFTFVSGDVDAGADARRSSSGLRERHVESGSDRDPDGAEHARDGHHRFRRFRRR